MGRLNIFTKYNFYEERFKNVYFFNFCEYIENSHDINIIEVIYYILYITRKRKKYARNRSENTRKETHKNRF